MIAGIAQFQQTLWAVNTAAGVLLLVLLAVRKNYRVFPAFSFYILMNLVLGTLAFLLYLRWGFSTPSSRSVGWTMQGIVLCTRAWAVAEICRHVLARYVGIWALARRILLTCAGLVLLYSSLAARRQWVSLVPSADRALELSIAAVIVVLLVFVRYYEVEASPADRMLAAGFCLYSCFSAVNNTILERYLYGYVALWNLLRMLAFLASLLLWTWALRKPQSETDREEVLLSPGTYAAMAPQINLRLRLLNEQLGRLWYAEGKKP